MSQSDSEATADLKPAALRLNETLVLAVAPIVGAILTFAYEAGFLSWYGVPYVFVRMDATAVLVAATAAAALFVGALGYARMIPVMPWKPIVCVAYLAVAPVFLAVLAYVLLGTIAWHPWSTFAWHASAGILCGVATYYAAKDLLIMPILRYRDEGDWGARWLRRMREMGAGKDRTLEDKFHSRIREVLGLRAAGLLLALYLGVILMSWWGAHRAATEAQHVLLRRGAPCIVIRRYGEGLLCVDIDTVAWRVLPRYRILPFVEQQDILASVFTGPLNEVQLDTVRRIVSTARQMR